MERKVGPLGTGSGHHGGRLQLLRTTMASFYLGFHFPLYPLLYFDSILVFEIMQFDSNSCSIHLYAILMVDCHCSMFFFTLDAFIGDLRVL